MSAFDRLRGSGLGMGRRHFSTAFGFMAFSATELAVTGLAVAALSVPTLAAGSAGAARNCEMVFSACPGRFDSATITVPEEVIWLNPVVPACDEKVQVPVTGPGSPPSIVFIIDNSGSMSEDKDKEGEGNDPGQARFNVVKSLLDTLRAASPSARVGLVIFTRRLAFDHRDNPYFKTAFPGDTSQHDSFAPLTRLDSLFPNGVSGVDTLKALLRYHGKGNLDYNTARPGSRPNPEYGPASTRDGTDITLGFQAAKVAMRDSRAAPADQFFIFLSDGAPTNVDEGREAIMNDFIKGENTPATFTVFFKAGSDNPKAPDNIAKMTENIRANGYSASNPKSGHWAINLPGSQLLALLQSNVLTTILTPAATRPLRAVLTSGAATHANTSLDSGRFVFPARIPLEADRTSLTFTYTYAYLDSGVAKEKTFPYTLIVKRSGAASRPPDGITESCRERADVALYRDGRTVQAVDADDGELEARLTLAAGEACGNCPIRVTPSAGADREDLATAAAAAGGYRAVSFDREISAAPVAGNGILEHGAGDSIILYFENPANPLDRARRAYPYSDARTSLKVDYHNVLATGTGAIDNPAVPAGRHWILVAPGALQPEAGDPGGACCLIKNDLGGSGDSLRHVGVAVEATGPFKADVRVFSNLGQSVNAVSLSIPAGEFGKLEPGSGKGTRRLRILWGNRAADGSLAGTGAYILKTTVTLSPPPGGSGEGRSWSDTRKVGLLRGE